MLANASTEGTAVVDVALPRMMAKTMIIITAERQGSKIIIANDAFLGHHCHHCRCHSVAAPRRRWYDFHVQADADCCYFDLLRRRCRYTRRR